MIPEELVIQDQAQKWLIHVGGINRRVAARPEDFVK